LQQWGNMNADYVACMAKGEVIDDPDSKWHEPAHVLLGENYPMRALGPLYVLSGSALRDVIIANAGRLRLLANEGVVLASGLALVVVTRFSTSHLVHNPCFEVLGGAYLDPDSCHFCKRARMLASMLRCLLYC
jgi:hypothetical protein